MNELTAHHARWRRPRRIVLYSRNILWLGVFMGWIASVGITAFSLFKSLSNLGTPLATNTPVERRQLLNFFSNLFLVHAILLATLIRFYGWPFSSLKAWIRLGLASAVFLSMAVGNYLGLSKKWRLKTWSPAESMGIYSVSALFAIIFLVQILFTCLEAWWLPKALRVPFHNEPTVKAKTKRNNDNRTITPITDGVPQQTTDAGPLERLFAQQSCATVSAQSVPEVITSVYGIERSKLILYAGTERIKDVIK
jgi:hypothetical protein